MSKYQRQTDRKTDTERDRERQRQNREREKANKSHQAKPNKSRQCKTICQYGEIGNQSIRLKQHHVKGSLPCLHKPPAFNLPIRCCLNWNTSTAVTPRLKSSTFSRPPCDNRTAHVDNPGVIRQTGAQETAEFKCLHSSSVNTTRPFSSKLKKRKVGFELPFFVFLFCFV